MTRQAEQPLVFKCRAPSRLERRRVRRSPFFMPPKYEEDGRAALATRASDGL
jgi:hypothetical protein